MYKKHDVEKMKELKRSGMSQSEIAKLLGASKQIVSYHTKDILPNIYSECIYCHSHKLKLHHEKVYKGNVVYVACRNCKARGPECSSDEEAISQWDSVFRNIQKFFNREEGI